MLSEPNTDTGSAAMTDDEKWQAAAAKDPNADAKFFYSVKTPGIYCYRLAALGYHCGRTLLFTTQRKPRKRQDSGHASAAGRRVPARSTSMKLRLRRLAD